MLLLLLSRFVLIESLPTPNPTLNPDKFVQTVRLRRPVYVYVALYLNRRRLKYENSILTMGATGLESNLSVQL